MARRRPVKHSWAPVIVGGVILGTIGVVAYATRASAKPAASAPTPTPILPPFVPPTPVAPVPLPQIPPLPVPSTQPVTAGLTPITDPTLVRLAQNQFAEGMTHDAPMIGLTPADYTAADVDGNPSNPRFVHALAAFQTWFNPQLAQSTSPMIPLGYPSQLRTDGVLDGATAWALANA